MNTYALIDSGNCRKLERFGKYVISRPSGQALWKPTLSEREWQQADAALTREGERQWTKKPSLPDEWQIEVSGIKFHLRPTDFGHLGIFPEQKPFWQWITTTLANRKDAKVLNLFAYSGGSTLAAAKAGASVCHLDASKGMVAWARENAALNGLEKAPIRWIIDDAMKFLGREVRRDNRYDAIILDPPTFGRGNKGEVFKIEEELPGLLARCRELLTPNPSFVLLSCHTPGLTPIVLKHMLGQAMSGLKGHIDIGEMQLTGDSESVLSIPNGSYARWVHEG